MSSNGSSRPRPPAQSPRGTRERQLAAPDAQNAPFSSAPRWGVQPDQERFVFTPPPPPQHYPYHYSQYPPARHPNTVLSTAPYGYQHPYPQNPHSAQEGGFMLSTPYGSHSATPSASQAQYQYDPRVPPDSRETHMGHIPTPNFPRNANDPPPAPDQPIMTSPVTANPGGQADPLYQHMQYSRPSPVAHYGYSPHSFTPVNQSLYHSPYIGTFTQPFYRRSPQDDAAGGWYYIPQPHTPQNYEQQNYDPAMQRQSGSIYRGDNAPPSLMEPPPVGSEQALPAFPADSTSVTSPGLTIHTDADAAVTNLNLPPPLSAELRGQPPESFHAPTSQSRRKPYHPNPPANRSEWVMWVGNVPSDATNSELWQFFNQPEDQLESEHLPSALLSPVVAGIGRGAGVSSVFLISRSNCAFVNFDTEEDLKRAVSRFHGRSPRPADPRCMKLVCRIRKADDDLKAGVGAQRGMGIHTEWVKERKTKSRQIAVANAESHSIPSTSSDMSGSSVADGLSPRPKQSSSSGSYASTTSSFLAKHFPVRYFILKSLNEADLITSVERGVWATQHHNEVILDQAFHTSNEVFLFFSANKSGEFFGYARMKSPIRRGGKKVSWASRSDSVAGSSVKSRRSQSSEPPIPEEMIDNLTNTTNSISLDNRSFPLISPSEHRMTDDSPGIFTPREEERLKTLVSPGREPIEDNLRVEDTSPSHAQSAPAEVQEPHSKLSYAQETRHHGTFDPLTVSTTHDAKMKAQSAFAATNEHIEGDDILRKDMLFDAKGKGGIAQTTSDIPGAAGSETQVAEKTFERKEAWGDPFLVEWVRTERLSFLQTKHLKNPWNHDREVKVSRDGTELEPSVGAALLAEWDKLTVPEMA